MHQLHCAVPPKEQVSMWHHSDYGDFSFGQQRNFESYRVVGYSLFLFPLAADQEKLWTM
jgi:hypothetical protein